MLCELKLQRLGCALKNLFYLLFTVSLAFFSSQESLAQPSSSDVLKSAQWQMLENFWADHFGGGSSGIAGDLDFSCLTRELLAKAAPDECFVGIGVPSPSVPPCGSGVPKVNEAYVWGLTKYGDNLWFGTGPNIHCLVIGGFLGATDPILTDSYVCEFGDSPFSPPLTPAVGDWRRTSIYRYNLTTKTLLNLTPIFDPLIFGVSGIRSAGSLNNVAILGGPHFSGGIALFAYNATTGAYLGSTLIPEYKNIRKWRVIDGVLYTGVGNVGGGGSVLRWTGSLASPFLFEVVGILDSEVAELAGHDGRLFVTTWPSLDTLAYAGLYMSPVIPAGGLTTTHAGEWVKIWESSDYDPDLVTAASYGGGALASFDGYLYWGTMHVPLLSALLNVIVYGEPASPIHTIETILGTYRAISIFRGRDFDTTPVLEVVYGMNSLPVFRPSPTPGGSGLWVTLPNNMGTPLFGLSGFGNFFNNYTWTMAVYDNKLYIGTMDWSYLAFGDNLQPLLGVLCPDCPPFSFDFPTFGFGADLYKICTYDTPALPESISGVGNYSNYGIRTMIADDALYLGMANPMNLLTDPTDDVPEGGWELLRLTNNCCTLADAIDLCPGLNLVSLPFALDGIHTGYDLLNNMQTICSASPDALWRFNCVTGRFQSSTVFDPATTFAITPGSPFWINLAGSANCEWYIEGEISADIPTSYELCKGLNLLSIPAYSASITKASELVDSIPGCNAVYQFNRRSDCSALLGFKAYFSLFGTLGDFPVSRTSGYWVNLKNTITWFPPTE